MSVNSGVRGRQRIPGRRELVEDLCLRIPRDEGTETIEYSELGDKNGDVYLFFHGSPGSAFTPASTAYLAANRVRLIVVSRPGYGRTSGCADEARVETVAQDAQRVLGHLEIGKPVVVCGASGGGVYAANFASVFSERVSALLLVSAKYPGKAALDVGSLNEANYGDEFAAFEARVDRWVHLARRGWPGLWLDIMDSLRHDAENRFGIDDRIFDGMTFAEIREWFDRHEEDPLVAIYSEELVFRTMGKQINAQHVHALVGGGEGYKADHRLQRTGCDSRMFESINVPATILYGEVDLISDPGNANVWRGVIPQLRSTLLPSIGHMGMQALRPWLFAQHRVHGHRDFSDVVLKGAEEALRIAPEFYDDANMLLDDVFNDGARRRECDLRRMSSTPPLRVVDSSGGWFL